MLRTWLTDRLDLTVPLVSAPMGGVSGGRLAAAVSGAGALGMIGFTGGSVESLRAEVEIAAAGGKPFGVGLLAWIFRPGDEAHIDTALEAGAALVSVSYGDYAPLVERVHAGGALFATQAGSVADARAAVDAGADVVVARGSEGGGHGPGEIATLPLLQAVLEAVDVPVLAAGGISNARGLAAVLAAGAAGAWVGTAFLACPEGDHPQAYRDAVLAAGETDTIYSRVFDIGRGIPWPQRFGGRALSTEFAERWRGRESELEQAGERFDAPVFWAGEGVAQIEAGRSAADVVASFAAADELLARVCSGATDG